MVIYSQLERSNKRARLKIDVYYSVLQGNYKCNI